MARCLRMKTGRGPRPPDRNGVRGEVARVGLSSAVASLTRRGPPESRHRDALPPPTVSPAQSTPSRPVTLGRRLLSPGSASSSSWRSSSGSVLQVGSEREPRLSGTDDISRQPSRRPASGRPGSPGGSHPGGTGAIEVPRSRRRPMPECSSCRLHGQERPDRARGERRAARRLGSLRPRPHDRGRSRRRIGLHRQTGGAPAAVFLGSLAERGEAQRPRRSRRDHDGVPASGIGVPARGARWWRSASATPRVPRRSGAGA